MAKVNDVIRAMEDIAPPVLAAESDRPRIGLHAGERGRDVKKVALALDAGLAAMEAALRLKATMLVVHHPRFYQPIRNLVDSDPSGRRGVMMVKSGLAVYSAHTNLDSAPGGINDLLASLAGIPASAVVEPTYRERLLKLAVFVPAGHADKMVKALDRAGAGAIGNYSGCTFRSRGVGTFRCGPGTKPFQGKPGSWEEADEYRLETVFGEMCLDKILAAMLAAHPYEEPAYDVYSVMGWGKTFGLGRAGELARPESVKALAARLAKATGSTETRYSGKGGRRVRRIGVWGGSGVPLEAFVREGVEAVVAGEVEYHGVEAFIDAGISLVTLGHGWSEEIVLRPLAGLLRRRVPGVEFVVAGKGFISMTNV